MGLTQSYPAVDHQGIKGIGTRFLRHRFTGPAGYPVTISFNKSLKGIIRIQLRVNLHLFKTRYDKRVLNRVVYDERKIHFVI